MRKNINLTIATDINGLGGIATVLNVFDEGGFFDKWNVRLISSHTQKVKFFGLNRIFLFLNCIFLVFFYHIFFNVGVVHIHTSSRWSFARKSLLLLLVKLLRGTSILHLHGSEFKDFYNNECGLLGKKYIRYIFNKSDHVVVLSSQWMTWMLTIMDNESKIKIIHNAVPEIHISCDDKNPNLILFLGRLGKRKGVADLILAFSRLANEFPDAQLALGGDGEISYYKNLVTSLHLEKRISFLGWVSGQEKISWLGRAGIYVLTSYNEGFPMGVIEAMSAGVPIVASKAGGIPDAVSHQKEALLVDAGDISSIENSLRSLLEDENLGKSLSDNAKLKFLNNFSTDAIFPKWDDIYGSKKT